MKYFIFCLSFLVASPLLAVEISVSGASAKALYNELGNRSHGVKVSEGKSTFGSKVIYRSLYDLMSCGEKDGWTGKSYRCKIQSTESTDLDSRTVISLGGDDIDDALAAMNSELNRSSVSSFSGLSAKVIFKQIEKLTEDKSYYTNTGETRWLKRAFVGFGIDEVYCQKVNGIFGEKFKCILPNVRASDTNAPAVIITDDGKK